MTKYAALFPGQGSQNKNMFESYEKNTIFNECITLSSQILGYDISKTIQDDSKLNNTIYTQPIMVATSIAMWNVWINKINIMPQLAAGHSLGEYSALVANQTLSLEDCLNLVTERAKFMVDAMTGVQGGMAAIMSNNPEMNLSETVEKVCEQLSNDKEIIQPVNYNTKNQIVIAGHKNLIDSCESEFKAQGVKRVIILPVSVAAHSSIMKSCSDKLFKLLNNIDILKKESLFPVIHNSDASIKDSKLDIIKSLCDQVCNPVLWEKTIEKIFGENIVNYIEIGPGKVLTGLNSKILINKDGVMCSSIDKYESIDEVSGVYNG